MALTEKKYSSVHDKTGSDKDLLKDKYDEGHINTITDFKEEYPHLVALVYQIQEMQEELDYLRTEISTNKDKTGISTSQANAITANTAKTGITTSQANAITANTAKTSMVIGTRATEAMAGSTYIPPIRVNLALGLDLQIQVRMIPPQKGQKKGTAQLGWILDDTINRVTYQSATPQILI